MKAYTYHNVFTFDQQAMDDHIFNELSKYVKGYPDVEQEWKENVEEVEIDTIEELLKWLELGNKLLEA